MPSSPQQFNVRMTEETAAKVELLFPAVSAALGVKLSQAQFFALAVVALERQYNVTTQSAVKIERVEADEAEDEGVGAESLAG